MAKPNMTTESGESGIYIFDGQIQGEEVNFDLMGKRGLEVYHQMRNDATVNASLNAIGLPIKSTEYRIDAASEDTVDVEAQELVDYSLFKAIDWKKFLGEALTMLPYGFSLFEMVFEPRYVNGKLRLALVKMGFRKQLSVYKWVQQDGSAGITQLLTTGRSVSIPVEKLVHIAFQQEGDNYEGRSALRPAYKNWKYKDKYYLIDALGAENQALGIADITYPKNATDKEKKAMQEWAKSRRANETAYIMRPEGWIVQIMDMKAKTLKDLESSINHHDNQILKNVLAQFLGLQTGSRALSEDHSKLFIKAVKEVADTIIYAVQRTAIKTLVDLNFTVSDYPQLAVGNVSDDNIAEVTEGIRLMVDAGMLHPSSADENVVRKMLSLPEKAIEELDELFAKAKEVEPKPAAGQEASVIELRALRASVEGALYGPTDQAA